MRTLHVGLRVADIDRSLWFYEALGYEVVGTVPETSLGQLTMLRLPGDEFVTVELVHDPGGAGVDLGNGMSHMAVHVESMDEVVAALAEHRIDVVERRSPDGTTEFQTGMVIDPDGRRIELVQWPAGHAAGLSAADWAD